VEEIQNRILGGGKLSPDKDKEFLKKLIYDRNNGVASRGQSILSEDNFNKLINDQDFIYKLEDYIKNPDDIDKFKTFENVWVNTKSDSAKNTPLLINRVAAACTRNVSTTADNVKFNYVFKWLIINGMIEKYNSGNEQDWFSKNEYLMKEIKKTFKDILEINETDGFYLSMFVWEIYDNISNPFRIKKQMIKYGSPGTGKTFQALEQTSLRFEIWKEQFPDSNFTYESQKELAQFHPSYSYEDFIEGLRPVKDDHENTQLTLQNGIFKDFCIKAGRWEIDIYPLHLDKDWEELTISDLDPYKEKLKGVHWDFIFKCKKEMKLSEAVPPFFFIIDEVNRAELSQVFGELMYCLEYRGVNNGAVKTQYSKLNNDETGMIEINKEYYFFVPFNIYLIGTMNVIDRSVESFDFALRRRFFWEEVKPEPDLLSFYLPEKWKNLADNLKSLNKKICETKPLLGPDYQIGHAYFMNLNYSKDLSLEDIRKEIWDDAIRPLLQEYLRGTGKEAELIHECGKAFGVHN
ncbi:MAG: AAA family ATPase, partial [Spirochaetota bacterium]|nr:AAA family ATPase [Spirochaetota bacterium]